MLQRYGSAALDTAGRTAEVRGGYPPSMRNRCDGAPGAEWGAARYYAAYGASARANICGFGVM